MTPAKLAKLKENPTAYAEYRKHKNEVGRVYKIKRLQDPITGEARRLKMRAEGREAARKRKEKNVVYMRKWRSEHRERAESDNIAKRINQALSKGWSPELIDARVGYSMRQLVAWLEKQFQPGMSWDNHGRGLGMWHIDHIKPVSKFDFTQPNAIQECWSLSNLRPMWAFDNLAQKPLTSYGLPQVPQAKPGEQMTLVPQ